MAGAPRDVQPRLAFEAEESAIVQACSPAGIEPTLDLIVEDIFDFGQEWIMHGRTSLPSDFNFRTSQYLWTAADISSRIRRGGMNEKFSRKHLVNVLRRLGSKWTNSQRSRFSYTSPVTATIHKGEITVAGRSKFWMPPLIKQSKEGGYFDDDATNY